MVRKLALSIAAATGIMTISGQKPNVIIILADDMGFSDIGCYGSEIPTPNIDALAENGVRFTQFYNTARCCPTRASLMTGLYPHQTGIGHMTESPETPDAEKWGTDGYQGHLNQNCVTMAQVLQQNGYHTYMTGKWHLGYFEPENRPLQRGFEKYYGIIAGASSYLKPSGSRGLTYQDQKLPAPDQPYYTTDAFTDSAIAFIKSNPVKDPFFLYLAFNAPHWPLQAKEEDIEKFRGKYKTLGWDKMRENRLSKQKELGIFNEEATLSKRDRRVRPWVDVDEKQKDESDYRMATYAAQVYCLDYNVGKLVSYLKETDRIENTVIIFMSDNGACPEPWNEFGGMDISKINDPDVWLFSSIGIGWANACNTPLNKYKTLVHEGGISTPFIVHWPEKAKHNAGNIVNTKGYLIDIMPTVLDLTNSKYPVEYNGKEIYPNEGISLVKAIIKGKGKKHAYMFWEHEGHFAVRKGDWKAIKNLKDEKWQLFNIANDRIESKNVAEENPELIEELSAKWNEWAYSHNVLPKRAESN
ncbi:arylsulfatase [Saccharicrinis sp. FJH62]|uniref:arylsulfatase n=1 Tax=Saccharicrinis sp. FJH62 TaxID=3344657 RepID=UPI0035D51DE5